MRRAGLGRGFWVLRCESPMEKEPKTIVACFPALEFMERLK